MESTAITSAMAGNAAFHRIFARLTKLGARVIDRSASVARDQAPARRARLQELAGRLKGARPPVGSFGVLQDALGALELPLDDVMSEAAALGEDAVELVSTMPGAFALMPRDQKREVTRRVLARPELAPLPLPSLGPRDATESQYCKEILALEIVESILALILALAVDVVVAFMTAEAALPLVVVVAIFEVIMFALAITIAVMSYQDCIGG